MRSKVTAVANELHRLLRNTYCCYHYIINKDRSKQEMLYKLTASLHTLKRVLCTWENILEHIISYHQPSNKIEKDLLCTPHSSQPNNNGRSAPSPTPITWRHRRLRICLVRCSCRRYALSSISFKTRTAQWPAPCSHLQPKPAIYASFHGEEEARVDGERPEGRTSPVM